MKTPGLPPFFSEPLRISITGFRVPSLVVLLLLGLMAAHHLPGQTSLSPRLWASVELFSPVPNPEIPVEDQAETDPTVLYPRAGLDVDLLGYSDFASFEARLTAQIPILQYNPVNNKVTYQGSTMPQLSLSRTLGTLFLGDFTAFWLEYGQDTGFYSSGTQPAVHNKYTDITRQGMDALLSGNAETPFPRLRIGTDLYHGPLTVRLWVDPLRPPAFRPSIDSPWYPADQFDRYREEFDAPNLLVVYQPEPEFHDQEYSYSDPRIHSDDLSFGLDLSTRYRDLEWFLRWYSGWNNRFQYRPALNISNPNQPKVNLTQYLHRADFIDTGFRLTHGALQVYWEGSMSPNALRVSEPVLDETLLRLETEVVQAAQLTHAGGFLWNTPWPGFWITGELGLFHYFGDPEQVDIPDFSRTLMIAADYTSPRGFTMRAGSLYDLTRYPEVQGAAALAQIGYTGPEGLEVLLSIPFIFAHDAHPLAYYSQFFTARLDIALVL